MKAVSNTTPLRYLIAIQKEHLLERLFEKVFVPSAVHAELTDPRTPDNVRRCVESQPSWLEVRSVEERRQAEFPVTLHKGERQAILLAEEILPDVLLLDERIGRSVASARNIPLSGTLGVLERADLIGLLDNFPETLEQLKQNGFFVTVALQELLLERHAARRRHSS